MSHIHITEAEAEHILNTEIVRDRFGIYRAKTVESDPKKCAINRHRRLRAINVMLGNATGSYPYLNWIALPREQDDDDDDKLCICGHAITKSHVIKYHGKKSAEIAHGSECITKVRKDFPDNPNAIKFVDDYKDRVAHMKRTCPTCKSKKLVKHGFCGGTFCKSERKKPKSNGAFFHFNPSKECLV